ncbi:glycosyltransferase family 2 protein [Neokomagataea thailandica]|uniref:Glycosyltransferase 2-like domain-containing protein n=1 Tax=Neokomagataea tanensis NBRC 106556 TaxID=1223519 RepID=A0ABQ0QI27_9PROT|nr:MULTISPECIES: glycosyltransferase family 2 protein [Neokomagataea]GBR45466.1 hypothetical protein AA106556_0777 [Neokomagataea tanensis NBRC 106556]
MEFNPLPRVAVVAIVRDEATDILSWLGWYIKLGVETLVIFDDGSSDGTERIIADAVYTHDIRLYKIENGNGAHIERQKNIYLYALKELKKTHDWVGFFDSDEYLYLENSYSIPAYLEKISQNVGAIGFHWCNYGSSGHVLKPNTSLIHAFDHHSHSNETINRHIKTLLRTDSWSGEWENVHCFPLQRGRYVDASGNDIEWSTLKGVTAHPPTWEGGRILHYQTRSMEHYVERAKRRKDIELHVYNFFQSDCNELYYQEPKKYIDDVNKWSRKVLDYSYMRALNTLINLIKIEKTENISGINFNIFELTNINGDGLCFEKNRIITQKNRYNLDGKLFVIYSGEFLGDYVYIFCCNQYGYLNNINLYDNYAIGVSFTKLIATLSGEGNNLLLQRIENKKYLRLRGDENYPVETINYSEIDENSLFSFKDYDKKSINVSLFILLQDALSKKITLKTLVRIAQRDLKNTVSLLPLLIPNLPQADREKFETVLGFKIQ